MNDTYKAYKGHNSPYLFEVTDVLGNRYSATKMAAITRMYIKYIPATGGTAEYADSDGSGHEDAFDWATYASTGRVLIDIGMLDFTAGRDATAEVVVYDADSPDGRVVDQIDLYVSEEAESAVSLVGTLHNPTLTLTVTDHYTITSANFGGSIRMNASTSKTITAPDDADSDDDGQRVTITKIGAGSVVIATPLGYFIASTSHTSLTGSSALASVTIEYVHAIKTWVVVEGKGSWTGGS
jgi:hypothetical protein